MDEWLMAEVTKNLCGNDHISMRGVCKHMRACIPIPPIESLKRFKAVSSTYCLFVHFTDPSVRLPLSTVSLHNILMADVQPHISTSLPIFEYFNKNVHTIPIDGQPFDLVFRNTDYHYNACTDIPICAKCFKLVPYDKYEMITINITPATSCSTHSPNYSVMFCKACNSINTLVCPFTKDLDNTYMCFAAKTHPAIYAFNTGKLLKFSQSD